MNKLKTCFFSVWLINSCGSDHKIERNNLSAIIGTDDRVQKQIASDTSVGSLEFDGQTRCTVVLISSQTVVTARHCYDELWARYGQYNVKINEKSYFVKPFLDFPNLDLIELSLQLPVTERSKNSYEKGPAISEPFYKITIDKISKMESYSLNQIDPDSKAILTQESRGNYIEEELGFLFHEFDTTPGASGSPIFFKGQIIGIHIGATKNRLKNFAVSSKAFVREKKRILKCRSIGYEDGSEDCVSEYNVRKFEPVDECYDNPGAAAGSAAGTYAGATAGAAVGGSGCTVVAPGVGTIGCGMYGAGVGSAIGAVVGACLGGYMWETYYGQSALLSVNVGEEINGRYYTGHALDRMQERGLVPSVVEETIKVGFATPSRDGTTVYETREVKVVVNEDGDVVTVMKRG